MKTIQRAFADQENNILNVKVSGLISSTAIEEIYTSITEEIEKLEPGFNVITDMSNFRIGNDEAMKIAHQLLELISRHKVGRIIRVVGNSQNAIIQSAEITKRVTGYNVEYVPTMSDAYRLLNLKQ